LSYCRNLTNSTISTITHVCTKLESLFLDGCAGFTDDCLSKMINFGLNEFSLRSHGDGGMVLSKICDTLGAFPNLTSINLRGQKINDNAVTNLLNGVGSHLIKADFSMCTLISDQSASHLMNCTSLIELHLEGCTMISEQTINNIFQCCKKLEIVGVEGCNILDITIITLLENVEKSMFSLALSGCLDVSSNFLPYLYKHKEMRILRLGRCIFKLSSIIEMIQNLPYLELLDLSRCPKLPRDLTKVPGFGLIIGNTFISHTSVF